MLNNRQYQMHCPDNKVTKVLFVDIGNDDGTRNICAYPNSNLLVSLYAFLMGYQYMHSKLYYCLLEDMHRLRHPFSRFG